MESAFTSSFGVASPSVLPYDVQIPGASPSIIPHASIKVAMAAVTRHGVPICYGVAAGAFAVAFAAGHAQARRQCRQGRRASVLTRRAVTAGTVTAGQRVQWSGYWGVVKFVGPVTWAQGEWIGLELDEPQGLHNGTVFQDSYYTCKPKHGVFCQATDLQQAEAMVGAGATPTTSTGTPAAIAVGQKVSWKGNSGTVKFVGDVAFATEKMVGVELDSAKGMHNGSLFGKTYFSCEDKHGVFCKAAELAVSSAAAAAPAAAAPVAASLAATPRSVVSAPVAASTAGGVSIGQKVSWKGNAGTVKFVGKVDFAAEEMVGIELEEANGMHNGSLFGKTYFSCQEKRGVFCKAAELGVSSAASPAPAVMAASVSPPVAAPVAAAPIPAPAPAPAMPVASSPTTSGISIGQKVSWKGNAGTVKFVGKVAFATEEMVGIELDAAQGMHNGSLFGKTYFDCQDKHGVFCKAAELGVSSAAAAAPAVAAATTPVAAPRAPAVAAAPVPAMAAAVAAAPTGGSVSVGQKVSWKGNSGTVKFVGKVDFATEEMVGVELDSAVGMHNGSLFGKTYFGCQEKHGVFCKVSEIAGSGSTAKAPAMAGGVPAPAVAASPAAAVPAPAPAMSMPTSMAAAPSASGVSAGQKVSWKGNAGTVKFVGKVDFAAEEMVGIELDTAHGMHNGSLFGKNYFSCQDKHGVFCKVAELGASSVAAAVPTTPVAASLSAAVSSPPSTVGSVGVGQKVSWKGNNGIVKFVGKVDFASEEMVGIELDQAFGMHNGSLFGKTYFSCQDKHGVFCKVSELNAAAAAAPAPAAPVASPKPPTPAPAPAPAPVPAAAVTATAVATPPATPRPTATASNGYDVGQKVVWKGLAGTVQYRGPVEFSAGDWIGIALDAAKGIHDGSVFGKSYFRCPMGYGILTQAAELRMA